MLILLAFTGLTLSVLALALSNPGELVYQLSWLAAALNGMAIALGVTR